MIFSINKKDISEKLQYLMGIVPSKSTMMVLANFKLEADKESNTLTIVATDLNITTIMKISANVIENGTLLVSAKHLSDIINSLPDTVINFSVKEDHLIIECENSNFTINYIESSLFPEINVINTTTQYKVEAENFKKLIQNTLFCASTDVAQAICNGVFLRLEQDLLTMAATDTKRIGEAKCKAEINLETPYEIVLPPRALTFIEKNINNDSESIIIKFNEHQISFSLQGILLISNRYEGRYPSYTVAFRNPTNYLLMVDKSKMKDAVRRVSLLSEDDDKLIKIALNNTEVRIESIISERGNAKESISGFSYDGPECFFCLNAKFLTSFLNAIESDEVLIKFRSTEEPIWVLNNINFEELEIRFIVMPMRINR